MMRSIVYFVGGAERALLNLLSGLDRGRRRPIVFHLRPEGVPGVPRGLFFDAHDDGTILGETALTESRFSTCCGATTTEIWLGRARVGCRSWPDGRKPRPGLRGGIGWLSVYLGASLLRSALLWIREWNRRASK
jgi:hypothetical protein